MESLAEQELKFINYNFYKFRKTHDAFKVVMGVSVTSAAAFPALIAAFWLLGDKPTSSSVIFGTVWIAVGFATGMWWHLRKTRLFKQIQSRCLKLQQAGYYVFLRHYLAGCGIDATNDMPHDDRELLDFEHLTADDLCHKSI